jgi:pimeloyl-ACP methyl ester carboxylesterase
VSRRRPPITAPGLRALLGELRAPLEAAAFLLGPDVTNGLPRGDGHPVLLLPPFGFDGTAMQSMARALERLGYAVHDWGEGRNTGLRQRIAHRLLARIEDLHRRHASALTLVGWSAGGLYARELARMRPDRVRRVITLGTPVRSHERGQAWIDAARATTDAMLAAAGEAPLRVDHRPPPVPVTAIHATGDGVVAAAAARETESADVENVAVDGTHLGLGVNRAALRAIAVALARREGA